MDIGEIVEIGERAIPIWHPAPSMVPVAPERSDEREPVTVPVRETEKVEQS